MPVIRLAAYPDSRVYTRAGVIVHDGMIFCHPVHTGSQFKNMAEGFEKGMTFLRDINWDGQVQLEILSGAFLYVKTPGGRLSLARLSNSPVTTEFLM